MAHDRVGAQGGGGVGEVEKAAPLQDTRFPEGNGQSNPQDELDYIRLREGSNDPDRTHDQRDNILAKASARQPVILHYHCGSPSLIVVKTPASIMPAILAERSKMGATSRAAETATARGNPSINRVRNVAPPAGRRRTTTSGGGRGGRAPPRPSRRVWCGCLSFPVAATGPAARRPGR